MKYKVGQILKWKSCSKGFECQSCVACLFANNETKFYYGRYMETKESDYEDHMHVWVRELETDWQACIDEGQVLTDIRDERIERMCNG